jgi:hypothetical protein
MAGPPYTYGLLGSGAGPDGTADRSTVFASEGTENLRFVATSSPSRELYFSHLLLYNGLAVVRALPRRLFGCFPVEVE